MADKNEINEISFNDVSNFWTCNGWRMGLGAALTMEILPPEAHGLVSGILQQGYAAGYIVAAIFYYLVTVFKHHWSKIIHTILLMAGLNFISRGTQDLYPTYLLQFCASDRYVSASTLDFGSVNFDITTLNRYISALCFNTF
ncbi:unnamed protein product [Rhizophagus irregularis]|nr:unnamed protein product [Rhizophagus irregularis]CAB4414837.1 unnamed protein product [Rhizophagus irregularis]